MHILICDDDEIYAKNCEESINIIAEQNRIDVKIDLVESGENLLFFEESKFADVDLIYLDWHMPRRNGFEVAQKLRERGVFADIVFYTMDESHAIDGYDVDALHYIVKGKTPKEKFETIFLKAVKRVRRRHTEVLSVSCAGEHRNIPVQDISFFEVVKRIITVHYYDNNRIKTFEFYSSLSKIKEFLLGKDFVRIHSSYLVNTRHIRTRKAQQIEMKDGSILPIGRSFASNIK